MRDRLYIFNLLLGLSLATSCSAPMLEVKSSPEGTQLYLDGRHAGSDQLRRDLPYFGSMSIDILPPSQQPGGPAYTESRHVMRVEPPASRWLFPFDFLIEIGIWAVTPDLPYQADLRAVELEHGLEIGTPPDLSGLRDRAMAARAER